MSEKTGLRVGIMGGTFNPIHMGHLLLAQTALTEENLDYILFMPSGCSYLKREDHVLEAAHRLKMTELAISDNPFFKISDMEIKREGATYTFETLKQLKKEQPTDSFYFIMGADCLFSIENWKNPREIFENCTLLAAVRDGASTDSMQEKCEELNNRYRADVKLLPFPETAISSTSIRKKLAEGKSVKYLVPDAVMAYIAEKHLYQA